MVTNREETGISSQEKSGNNQNEKQDLQEKLGDVQYLNFGEDDQMEIQGFVRNKMKTYMAHIFYVLTFGTLRLFFHWYPHLAIKATHTRCSLDVAEKVLIINTYRKFKSYFVKEVHILRADDRCDSNKCETTEPQPLEFNLNDGRKKNLFQARTIRCMKLTYIWDEEKSTFIKLAGFDKGITKEQLHRFAGQSKEKQNTKRIVYGNNEISVPVQTILTLLVLEALTPFYVFQLFSLIVWLCELYLYYTFAIIIMSVVGITTSIIQTRKNQKNLKGTVHSTDNIIVCRGDNQLEQILTTDLVPGDVIVIPSNGCLVQCDAVLLTGSCVVNESMLTGESVPITKTPLPNSGKEYKVKEDGNHTLFCGTRIIQTRTKGNEKVLAVVIRTGYLTAKGELVRSILYPPPADFKFESDSYKFIAILSVIAFLGVIYTVVSKSTRNINTLDILIKSLDLITIAVPPALPAAMTVGKLYALNRLKNSRIFCINSRVINVTGSVDCICFDKTGTLTEDELDMWGIVPIEGDKIKKALTDVTVLPDSSHVLRGMATCHSLNIIDGEMCGDPLDMKMFQSTGWTLTESNKDAHHHVTVRPQHSIKDSFEIGICKQFQFSSALQRMSVITKSSDSNCYTIYCKGSPEMIVSLSKPSTVPQDTLIRLKDYTTQGYRVIALAKRDFDTLNVEDLSKLHREDVECDLDFVGLIVLENKLKPQTTGVIKTLKEAKLKTVMITGDNIQTALHVAKDCGMVEWSQVIVEVIVTDSTKYEAAKLQYQIVSEAKACLNEKPIGNQNFPDIEKQQRQDYCFAITGNSWGNLLEYFPETIPKIVAKGAVFARMSGLQKQQLIEELKNLGYYVAMCGDGANDCGALRAAHVGVSLSEAESSVASPFTSKEPNISCIPKVIKEGRAALVTSFGVFKLMLCYSLTEFASVMILYNIDSNLTSLQFLFIDICLILNFSSVFGMTKAYKTLDVTPPMTSLMSFIPIASMVFFMVITIGFQIFSYYYVQTFLWFHPFVFNEEDDKNYLSYENYAVFTVSMFQYITMAIVFSKGKPYRKALYTNIPFTLSLLVMIVVCTYITLTPAKWVMDILELLIPPAFDGRYAMLWIALIGFVCCIVAEDFIVEFFMGKILAPRLKCLQKSKRKFLSVLKDIEMDFSWPRLEDETAILSHVYERGSNGTVNNGFVGSQNILITRC